MRLRPRHSLATLLLGAAAVAGCGSGSSQQNAQTQTATTQTQTQSGTTQTSTTQTQTSTTQTSQLAQLPGGGREIVPRKRVVAYYGAPQNPQLGALGVGSLSHVEHQLRQQADAYKGLGRPVLPAMELIVTIADASPGPSGLYRSRQSDATVRHYLHAARSMNALLILDIQPGRADFMDEVKHLHQWLVQPDVSLALDPEWHMGPGEVPGQTIGSTDAATINQVSSYVEGIVKQHKLPQKILIVHRFTVDMIQNADQIKPRRPHVAIVETADGFGSQQAKITKYERFDGHGDGLEEGFKLFYHEDTNMMTPKEVMKLKPPPDVVIYE